MSTLETAENIVSKLNTSELIEFRKWFAEYHGTVWDEQIEADAAAGNSTRLPKRPSPNTEQTRRVKFEKFHLLEILELF